MIPTPPGDGWRYIAQRVNGTGSMGDFLDFNVPLQGVNIEEVLSGHNSLTGRIAPEYARLKDLDGNPILEEYQSAIWAESPDGNLWGGLLTHSGFGEGGVWEIECTDLSGITIELPFIGAEWYVNVDPLDIYRRIWLHIQRQRNSNLGITIDPTKSPVRIGSDLVQRVEFDLEPDPTDDLEPIPAPVSNRFGNNSNWRDAAVKALTANGWKKNVVLDALNKWLSKDSLIQAGKWKQLTDKERKIRDRSIQKVGWPPNPPNPGFSRDTLVVNMRPQIDPPSYVEPGIPDPDENSEEPTYQYEAYKLNWYTNFDLSAEIDRLSSETPFDWHLRHWWDGEEIRHHIRLGYPRLGRRRTDLRFVVGENIHKAPKVERDGADYANEVIVLGAGEGSAQIMARGFRSDGRVRRVAVVSDTTIKTQKDAQARANSEVARRSRIDDIAEVLVTDHPHAPMGSIDLGDEILVEGDIGWVDLSVWCRIVSRGLNPDDSNVSNLTVVRTDRIG